MLQDIQRMGVNPLGAGDTGLPAAGPSLQDVSAFNAAMNGGGMSQLGGMPQGHGAGCPPAGGQSTMELLGNGGPAGTLGIPGELGIGGGAQGATGLPGNMIGNGGLGTAGIVGGPDADGINGGLPPAGLPGAMGANGGLGTAGLTGTNPNPVDDPFAALSGNDQLLQPQELLAAVQGTAGPDGAFNQQEFAQFGSALGIDPQSSGILFEELTNGSGSLPGQAVADLANQSARPDGTWGREEFNNVLLNLANVIVSSEGFDQGAAGAAGAPIGVAANNPQAANPLQGGIAPAAPQTAAAPNPLNQQLPL